ncbi:MAG: hypothetical protein GF353_13080 [Candidatus Lokiarchaeota archaeon]|nr:hypothetical protein [Candidatus Lokiarchaeota archaeon]
MDTKKLFNIKKRLLLEHLVKSKYLKDKRLFKAFLDVPLEDFIPKKYMDPLKIYEDIPNLFYFLNPENYRTISAPHMISIMLQGLSLKDDDDLLVLGAKSGYIASLAHKLAPNGEIIILEANAEIAKITMQNLKRLNLDDNITVTVKNPLEGMLELSPWQKILVTGAIKQERIHPLLRQLDSNEGVLYAPIGEDYIQIYTQILRIKEEYFGKQQLQVRFTPLMTQVELDEIELITDFEEYKNLDEIEVKQDPSKVESVLDKNEHKINIKYASNILDEVDLEPTSKSEKKEISIKERDIILSYFEKMLDILRELKKQEDVEKCFEDIDEFEIHIDNLKKYKSKFQLKPKRFLNLLNQIRSYLIVRKDINKSSDTNSIEQKIEVINKQNEIVLDLEEFLESEISRIKKL